jgi:nudix-type nucleoside diphosphatase (YffH/AdpP family)
MPFEITAIGTKHAGWTRFLVASIRLPSGHLVRREIEDHGAAVAVLPYDPQRKTAILVQQFRAPVLLSRRQDRVLEAIAGIIEDIDPPTAARREAREEAGLNLSTLEQVGCTFTMPGISTEQMTLFLAPYQPADRISAGGGLAAEHEHITVVEITLARLDAMLVRGDIADMKTLVLAQALKLRHPHLF